MGRTQWQNKLQNFGTVSATGLQMADVFDAVNKGIRSRATIVAVRGTIVSTQTNIGQAGSAEVGLGLVIGPLGGFTVDPDVLTEGEDHSWLWTGYDFTREVATATNTQKTRWELDVKSSRRLR